MGRLEFLYNTDLPHRAISVYTYLYDRANKQGECWPAISTISKDLKLSLSTVRRAIKDLKKSAYSKQNSVIEQKAARAVYFIN